MPGGYSNRNPAPLNNITLPAGQPLVINMTDASFANARADMMTFRHQPGGALSSGVGGFGSGIRFEGPKADGVVVDMATIEAAWSDPDAANPYGRLAVYCRRYGTANFKSIEIGPDSTRFLAGSVTSPGIAFLANGSYGLAVSGSDGGSNRLMLATGGVSNIGCNDVGVCFLGQKTVQPAQTGGALTAGGSYSANEQSMLQKAYGCLRTFGFLT